MISALTPRPLAPDHVRAVPSPFDRVNNDDDFTELRSPGFAGASAAPPTERLAVPADMHALVRDGYRAGVSVAQKWETLDRSLRVSPGFVQSAVTPFPSEAAQGQELLRMHQIADARTPAGADVTNYLREHGVLGVWQYELKQYAATAGWKKGLIARRDLYTALALNTIATTRAKSEYARQRPFRVDPTLTSIAGSPKDGSYPSGHTSSAFTAATVLAAFMPERAAELYALAEQVAYSRVYGGVHFPSDIRAGAMVGTAIARIALQSLHAPAAAAWVDAPTAGTASAA